MFRKAVIDVGSNSVKLLVAEKGKDGALVIVFDDVTVSRLGAGMEKGKGFFMQEEAMQRNCRVICDYVAMAREFGVESMTAVGTMALRTAANRVDFMRMVRDACGLNLKVLTGLEEAHLAFRAILSSLPIEEQTVIFDTGGGSTEIICLFQGEIIKKISIPLGCIGITADYLNSETVGRPFIEDALKEITVILKKHGVEEKPDLLIGIGGTVTTMGAVKHKMREYNPQVIQGSHLTREDVEDQIVMYAGKKSAERCTIPGLGADRADIILGGACIILGIMNQFSTNCLTISDRGMRHGIMEEFLRHE